LSRIHTVITDDGISDSDAEMLSRADIRLIVAEVRAADRSESAKEG
jgi:DeoR family transcriptional regulator, ulaG and ulaABCDEF operon transcriptional repressor